MKKDLTLTRRTFVKSALATAAISAMGVSFASGALAADSASTTSSAGASKRIRTCCRACGKMECGVWVTVANGKAIRVEGDETAHQSAGNCCSKSQSSIQACYHPARVHYPMKRSNPRDDVDPGWERITWDEAWNICAVKYKELMEKYGGEAMICMSGTSRVWCMDGYAAGRQLFQTPNSVTPWQVCKGPRHFATAMQSAYAFSWQSTVERPRVFVRWGAATELSNYDDSCRTTVDTAVKSDYYIMVDPRMTNLGKEADIWQHLRPGTDAALAFGWCNVIIKKDLIDDLFVKKWTNGAFLVCDDIEPSGYTCAKRTKGNYTLKTTLLKESDLIEGGKVERFMVWDDLNDRLTYYDAAADCWEGETWVPKTAGKKATKENLFEGVAQGWVTDPSGFDVVDGFATPIDPALYGEYTVTLKDGRTSKVRPVWDLFAERVAEYDLDKVSEITGIPASEIENAATIYATRLDPTTGYGNGGIGYMLAVEHQCNSIQNCRLLDTLCGMTGNWDIPAGMRGPSSWFSTGYNFAGSAPALSQPAPEQWLKQCGIQEYPVLEWWQSWADASSMYTQMKTGDPYPIVGGFCQSGDFMNMGNTEYNWDALSNLQFFLVVDLWQTPFSGKADVFMPVHHWIEINAPRPSQGSGGAVGCNIQCVEGPGDTLFDPDAMMGIFKAMGQPWMKDPNNPWPAAYPALLDFVTAQGGMTWAEFSKDFADNGWWDNKAKFPSTWGTYRRYETGKLRKNAAKKEVQGLPTPTGKMEIWSTIMETFYPDREDCLPIYKEPPLSPVAAPEMYNEYPLICNTGRRIPVYFHNEHRQLPWCRELWTCPRMEINPADAAKLGLEQGDWAWIESKWGKIRQVVDIYPGIKQGQINCEHQWWFPELEQSGRGFGLSGVNCLIPWGTGMQDRHCGSGYLRAYPVKVYKATAENSPFNNPVPCGVNGDMIIHTSDDIRLKEWAKLDYEGR